MSKKPAAALCALLTFAAVLAIVPLATAEPAEAHEQTKTVRRCAYDPFAGQQCWNETVKVAHTHRVIPDNPPPDTSPKRVRCPKGTTGTPPNCSPAPSDNTRRVTPTTAAPPPPTTAPPPPPPPTTAPPPPPPPPPAPLCAEGTHRYGSGCHADHVASCGNGTWTAHSGHAPVKQKPCETNPNKHGTTYTVKPCSPYQESLETVQRHKHPIGDRSGDSACHRVGNSHCPAGHTETGGHGSQTCRKNDAPDNIVTRTQHLIETGGSTGLEMAVDAIKEGFEQQGQSGIINAEGTAEIGKIITETWDSLPESVKSWVKGTGCGLVASLAVASIWASAGSTAPAWATWTAGTGAGAYCSGVLNDAIEWGRNIVNANDQQQNNGNNQNQSNDQRSDAGDDDEAQPTPEAVDDPIPENPTPAQYGSEFQRWSDAIRKHQQDEISDAERKAATDRWKQVRCNRGRPGDQHYC